MYSTSLHPIDFTAHFLLCLILLLLKYSSACSSPCFFLLAFLLLLLFLFFFFSSPSCSSSASSGLCLRFLYLRFLLLALKSSKSSKKQKQQKKQQKHEWTPNFGKQRSISGKEKVLASTSASYWQSWSTIRNHYGIKSFQKISIEFNRYLWISWLHRLHPLDPQTPTFTGWVQLPRLKSQTFESHGAPRSLCQVSKHKIDRNLRDSERNVQLQTEECKNAECSVVFCVFIIVIVSHRVLDKALKYYMQLGQKHKFQLHCHYIS